MEVKMNKEIRNYQESMFMGLNLRQCIFSLLAIAVAVRKASYPWQESICARWQL